MSLKFEKVLIADERYESVSVFDVNNDGILDIVSGAYWYEGPTYRKRHKIAEISTHNDYYDSFANIPLDINGNGYLDFITGSWFNENLRWYQNPKSANTKWTEHTVAKVGNIEAICAWDIDQDGILEIVPNVLFGPVTIYKLILDAKGVPTGKFSAHEIFEGPQYHGLGAGDIAGNKRMDIVLNHGWLEAPAKPYEQEWIWHPEFKLFNSSSVPIIVADVNSDGINDIIVGAGHDYGLSWYEQRFNCNGERFWQMHPIDPWNSQYHTMQWVDIDNDGEKELITGKRYRAHNTADPGATEDYGLYYFKWTGENFVKQVITYGGLRQTTGTGLSFATADLTGNNMLDIIVAGKDGLYIFYNLGY